MQKKSSGPPLPVLTKIDQGRAVRNRMTLQEITQILGEPDFDYKEMGTVLNIFREPAIHLSILLFLKMIPKAGTSTGYSTGYYARKPDSKLAVSGTMGEGRI